MYQSGHTFNQRSLDELAWAHPSLRLVLLDAMRVSDVPFQVVQGRRMIEQQQAYFDAGKSKINPKSYTDKLKLYADAKHVVGPEVPLARAVDIVIDVKGKAYDREHLAHVAGVVLACARFRETPIRWGGNFDRDSEILEQAFDDMPHFEIDA